ncbi:M14 family metallopeptidase [Aestuariibaculum sp. M13]|uniref:M14 family metallopeptidase n=1 Tax=Aestuariibaculum sp. M13 TaxID=2967132 RepID=UPI00215A0AB7|nr:M14 family metallopeptidase [Aestuariibaculum sp. M13]MCR8666570.1 M14 family metallopeptidase [Aestuariibaculum sp. M13]
MPRFILLLIIASCLISCNKSSDRNNDFTTRFETSKGTETSEYNEIISFYKDLSNAYSEISLFEIGETDSGKPLHVVVYNSTPVKNLEDIKHSSKNKILINNGIHPGESDGIDASMMLIRDIVKNDSLKKAYNNSILAFIAVYNVGGALNRNSFTRANQNGPKSYGFRGNARNYDLNRDFIKEDSKNAAAFAKIFHCINPDVFIDNHVSNGADYQYAITHLFTQHNKLGGKLGSFIEQNMKPEIEGSLLNKDIIITPYVNVWGNKPEIGFSQFFDSPRYSTGYTSLFNTLGLMVETHMLKPYDIRVKQTYELMLSTFDFTEKHSKTIKTLRENAVSEILSQKTYPISYTIDSSKTTNLEFKGYEGSYIESKVTSGTRLFYDRNKPFSKTISYYNNFIPEKSVSIPKAYILKQGWHDIIERLKNNHIEFSVFKKDTILTVEVNHIDQYKTASSPFEGHYLHSNTSVLKTEMMVQFNKGDLFIPTSQNGIRYLLETLEAEATDSFFNWNFFDTILQQKEHYSAYVFEDLAENYLKNSPELRAAFETKLATDKVFAQRPNEQLEFIYKNSPHYEDTYLQLPVYKVF